MKTIILIVTLALISPLKANTVPPVVVVETPDMTPIDILIEGDKKDEEESK